MRALIEFLSDEPLDNFITALSYDVDQIIYFGYEDKIAKLKDNIEKFAKSNSFGLGMKQNNIIFKKLKPYDFAGIIKTIYDYTMDIDGDIFFDITGGDDLILVAFGRVAEQIDAPLYNYDFENDKLVEIQKSEGRESLLKHQRSEKIVLDFPGMECLYNWKLKTKPDEEFKAIEDAEFLEDVEELWALERKYGKEWNFFLRTVDGKSPVLSAEPEFQPIIDDLVKKGLLKKTSQPGYYSYKNDEVQKCLSVDGSVLEIITYRTMLDQDYEAKVGVPIEWKGSSVNNEIDVLAIKDNIPTFISCKAGNVTDTQIYELDTLARRVCGKYAKKIVALALEPEAKLIKTADEHGVEVWIVDVGFPVYEDAVDLEDATYEG